MKILFVLLVFIGSTFNLLAQKSTVISGKVVDSINQESLPYANVVYKKKMLGTITNSEGKFTLSLAKVELMDSILFSFIGYKPLGLVIGECSKGQIFALEPTVNEIAEVKVTGAKFKLNPFLKETIIEYNRNRRQEPHIAIAHYREKAKEKDKYIMFMESIGYSVYAGTIPNATKLSNYKFFCENSRSFSFHPDWIKYGTLPSGHDKKIVSVAGGKNANTFRRIELKGILSQKSFGKYSFKIDSTYFQKNQEILVVHFKGNNDEGQICINRVTKQIIKISCNTNKIYSRIPIDNGRAKVNIQFNYFGESPFVSRMETRFTSGTLDYTNTLTILLQKLNQFSLSKDEYWSFNLYDHSPYIDYKPLEFVNWNITNDSDYNRIEKDLLGGEMTLEEYFVQNSGYWYLNENQSLKVARETIYGLKVNF